eukprot:11170975-Ditylum_brightwellii.AAC.1
MVKRCIDTIFGAIRVAIVIIVTPLSSSPSVSCVKPKTQPTLPQNSPKNPLLPNNNKQTQQSAVRCLCRHQWDTIVPPPPPPWRRSAVIRHWCHSPGPKTRKWHQQCRGSVAQAKPQQATLSPCVNDTSGASYRWRRWWGRRGRSDG